MMIDNIIRALDVDGKCWITFKSMTSDAQHTHLYEKSGLPSKGDKLIVVNADTRALEDIEKTSIFGWSKFEPFPKRDRIDQEADIGFRTMKEADEFGQSLAVQKTRERRKSRYDKKVENIR